MGRPTKLTPELQARFMQAISVGSARCHACAFAGISHEALSQWIEKGIAGREPFVAFVAALKEAEGKAVVGWMAKIEVAANDGSWQAAAWKLERRYPQEYGRTVQVQEHTGLGGGPIAFEQVKAMTKEERQARLVVLRAKQEQSADVEGG